MNSHKESCSFSRCRITKAFFYSTSIVVFVLLISCVVYLPPCDSQSVRTNSHLGSGGKRFDSGSDSNDDSVACFCQLHGSVDECVCSIESVDAFNNYRIAPVIAGLVQKDYFRYFKVNLEKACPFWPIDWACANRHCGIEECASIPPGLKFKQLSDRNVVRETCDDNLVDPLNMGIAERIRNATQRWIDYDDSENKFCDFDDDQATEEGGAKFVDLLLNPERHTGYAGPSAARVWRSIYEENCFRPNPRFDKMYLTKPNFSGLCIEKRVFYRAISGLHSSISTHIAAKYYKPAFVEPFGFGKGTWSQNLDEFTRRFTSSQRNSEGMQWLRNLYFVYLVELRALQKVAPYLRRQSFFTGNASEDLQTAKMMSHLLDSVDSFAHHFNDSQLFQYPEVISRSLKAEFREHFRNISRVIDCVGCDKCRLWGKLQITGLGTALRILLTDQSLINRSIIDNSRFQLQRTEIVALLNSFKQLSDSVREVDNFRTHLQATTMRKTKRQEGVLKDDKRDHPELWTEGSFWNVAHDEF